MQSGPEYNNTSSEKQEEEELNNTILALKERLSDIWRSDAANRRLEATKELLKINSALAFTSFLPLPLVDEAMDTDLAIMSNVSKLLEKGKEEVNRKASKLNSFLPLFANFGIVISPTQGAEISPNSRESNPTRVCNFGD